VFRKCLAAARVSGQVQVVTVNRWSLAGEPTVRLWGVGFLPRRLAVPYVRLRRHTSYEYVRPLTPRQLDTFRGSDRAEKVSAGPLPPAPPGTGRARRVLQRLYDRARARPTLARLLRWVAPYLQVRRY
jgi:hypothetical protein